MKSSTAGGQALDFCRPPRFPEATLSEYIQMPGIPAGMSLEAYLPLMQQYAATLEANRILDRFRPQLSQLQNNNLQAPLTPLVPSNLYQNLYYKREDLTTTRAYKVRGALVGMAKHMELAQARHFVAVSTGNHALGVLKAAELLRPASVRIVVPHNTAENKLVKIDQAIATLKPLGIAAERVTVGGSFDEARAFAMAEPDPSWCYLDPYSDPWVVAGQGTLGFELFQQIGPLLENDALKEVPPKEVLVISPVGGGGLLAGTATALKLASAWDSRFRGVHLRFLGLRLSNPQSPLGDAIRVNQVAPRNQQLMNTLKVENLRLQDSQMTQGRLAVKQDLGVWVEGASAGTLAAVLGPVVQPSVDAFATDYSVSDHRLVVCLLSGGNVASEE